MNSGSVSSIHSSGNHVDQVNTLYSEDTLLTKMRLPKKVYSSRLGKRNHSKSADVGNLSSPLKQTSDNVNVEEMSRRMLKKSRLALRNADELHGLERDDTDGQSDQKRRRIARLELSDSNMTKNIDSYELYSNTDISDHDIVCTASSPSISKSSKKLTAKAISQIPAFPSSPSLSSPHFRTSSHKSKENSAILFSGLASPFRDRASLASKQRKRYDNEKGSFKRNKSAAMNRRQSGNKVNSTEVRRYPSGSHELFQKIRQDWLVPAQIDSAFAKNTPTTGPNTSNEFSFLGFMLPQACSTPISTSRSHSSSTPLQFISDEETPDIPSFLLSTPMDAQFSISDSDVTMNESTPKIKSIDNDLVLALGQSLTPLSRPENTERQNTKFSSNNAGLAHKDIDIPALELESPSPQRPDCDLSTPRQKLHDLPVIISPVAEDEALNSDGDELRNMFSILGLDEDSEGNKNSSATPSEHPRKTDEGKRGRRSYKSLLINTRRSLNRAAIKERKLDTRQNRSGEYGGASAPKKPDESEVVTNLDDEEDELLLTYRGWDWDPKKA